MVSVGQWKPYGDFVPSMPLARFAERLGAVPGPDLVHAATRCSLDDLAAICEEVNSSTHAEVDGPSSAGELWPLLNARSSTFATGAGTFAKAGGPAGVNLFAALDANQDIAAGFQTGVLRALLYCHGLVLEDPLGLAVDMLVNAPVDMRETARVPVVAAISTMSSIAPLIDGGVVSTYFTPTAEVVAPAEYRIALESALDDPKSNFDSGIVWDAFEGIYIDSLTEPLRDLWADVRKGNTSPPIAHIEAALASGMDPVHVEVFIDAVAHLDPKGVVSNLIAATASAARDISLNGGRHDLFCSTRLEADLINAAPIGSLHARRLGDLASIDVPRLDDLALTDVVRIRKEDDDFHQFRLAVAEGLERAHNLVAEDPSIDPVAIVAESVAAARYKLTEATRRSTFMSDRINGLLGFAAGAVAGAAGAAAGSASAIAIGAAGGLIPPLAAAVARRSDNGFLQRHYLLFEPRR